MNEMLQDLLKKSGLGNIGDATKESENAKLSPEDLKAKLENEKKIKEEAEEITKAFDRINPAEPINGENELNLYMSLMHGAETLLRKYPTSLEQDVLYFSKEYQNAPNAVKLTPKQTQALMMRIEIKRILHATILESMLGMRNAYKLQAKERDYDLPNTDEGKKDTDVTPESPGSTMDDNEMETKRVRIQSQMLKHFDKGTSEWQDQWETWREEIRLTWGQETALPKGSDFATRLGSSEEIIQRATERFDSSGDNTEGIRIGDFLRFTDVLSKGMEKQMKNQNVDDLKGFAGA